MDNEKIQNLFSNLKYFGKMEKPNFVGTAIDSKNADILYVQLKVNETDVILDAKYRIINKPVVYAICEILTQIIMKKDIKSVQKKLTKDRINYELGDIPEEYLYVVDLYNHAVQDIIAQISLMRPQDKEAPKFKRILNFDENDDLDTLSKEQVKKLLDAVEDLNMDKNIEKISKFNKVKETVIGKLNDEKIKIKKNTFDKNTLLNDNVPDFNIYEDNTKNLKFENLNFELPSDLDLKFEENLVFTNETIHLEEPDLEFDENLDFSNYDFSNKKNKA